MAYKVITVFLSLMNIIDLKYGISLLVQISLERNTYASQLKTQNCNVLSLLSKKISWDVFHLKHLKHLKNV